MADETSKSAESKSSQPPVPQAPVQAPQPRKATGTDGAVDGVYPDGSTVAQREEHIKAAEETNRLVHELADNERKAREGS